MVTFDSKYADEYASVKSLLRSGMNLARINCTHDDEGTWSRMIQHFRRASRITGLNYKIYIDLAGPNIRTTLNGKSKLKDNKQPHFFPLFSTAYLLKKF